MSRTETFRLLLFVIITPRMFSRMVPMKQALSFKAGCLLPYFGGRLALHIAPLLPPDRADQGGDSEAPLVEWRAGLL
jgi:hypothetical protein